MTRYFRMPTSFASFLYLSQLQQALAIETAVRFWRSLKPHTHGHALLAAQRRLAVGVVVEPRPRRRLEDAALSRPPLLRADGARRAHRGRPAGGLRHERRPDAGAGRGARPTIGARRRDARGDGPRGRDSGRPRRRNRRRADGLAGGFVHVIDGAAAGEADFDPMLRLVVLPRQAEALRPARRAK